VRRPRTIKKVFKSEYLLFVAGLHRQK